MKRISIALIICSLLPLSATASWVSITYAQPTQYQVQKLRMAHTAQDTHEQFFNSHMDYITWGGQAWRARFNPASNMFVHTPIHGRGQSHSDYIINYISWDGAEWTAVYNPSTHLFTHTNRYSGQSHNDAILNYKSPDGRNWTVQFV